METITENGTATAKTKAGTEKRSIVEIIGDLKQPLPPRLLKTRVQGGTELTYIEWFTAVELLDFYTNCHWSGEVVNIAQSGNRIVVTYRVTIHALEGDYVKEATGSEVCDSSFKGYGEPNSNAEAQAFKRAAAKHGLTLYLYKK